MSKALPAILTIGIGIATGGLGTAAAAVVGGGATFAQFATVAGAALSGIGAVTGKKDLMKIGGLVSLGAGLASGFSGAAGEGAAAVSGEAAQSGVDSASSAWDMADSAAGSDAAQFGLKTAEGEAAKLGANADVGSSVPSKSAALQLNQPQEGGMLGALNKIGANVRQNKELYSLGGQMLQGMFGPEAEAMDYRKAADERRRRNMNTIIPVGRIGG